LTDAIEKNLEVVSSTRAVLGSTAAATDDIFSDRRSEDAIGGLCECLGGLWAGSCVQSYEHGEVERESECGGVEDWYYGDFEGELNENDETRGGWEWKGGREGGL